LYSYSQSLSPNDIRGTLERHYSLMTAQAVAERTVAIEMSEIWKRCSVFLFAAETMSHLSSNSIDLYKCYLNYNGLAHDTHDLLSDLSDGVESLPARWMREASPD